MNIEIRMNGQCQASEDSKALCAKSLDNKPFNRAEFMAYLQCIANDYWEAAIENEDIDPAKLGAADRIEDFSIYLHENCR